MVLDWDRSRRHPLMRYLMSPNCVSGLHRTILTIRSTLCYQTNRVTELTVASLTGRMTSGGSSFRRRIVNNATWDSARKLTTRSSCPSLMQKCALMVKIERWKGHFGHHVSAVEVTWTVRKDVQKVSHPTLHENFNKSTLWGLWCLHE